MTRRLESLDVARGTAMLFVCLSHFAGNFLNPVKNSDISPLLARIGTMAGLISMIASPTFVIVSGSVIGCLYTIDPARMPALRRKLLDRGLFLLLVGHLLQAPAYAQDGQVGLALQVSYITDAIGVAIIVGPTLVLRTPALWRIVAGITLVVLSWATTGWEPRSTVGVFLDRYAFGASTPEMFVGFPSVPWLGVYLLATVLGQRIGRDVRAGAGEIERTLVRLGGTLAGVGVAIAGVRLSLHAWAPALRARHPLLDMFFGTMRKFPPGPVYLTLFAGAGLLLIATAFALSRQGRWRPVTASLATLGRASFFIFIIQAYVYFIVLPAVPIPYPNLWPLYYALTIAVFVWASSVWNRLDANRYLTVGLWRTVPLARAVQDRIRTAFVLR